MSARNTLAEFYDAELANVTGRLFDAINENKRLREALTEISDLYSGGHGYRAKEIATRALNQQLKQEGK